MSELKVDTVVNLAGTGKPNFQNGVTVNGAATSTLNLNQYTASSSEPSNPDNGALWWDTANEKTFIYAEGEWKETIAVAATLLDGGTRGIYAGGEISGGTTNVIAYWTIDTAGNATDFGDLRTVGDQLTQDSYGFSDVTNGYIGSNWVAEIMTITIATTGNATDYGDLTGVARFSAGNSNGSVGLVAFGQKGGTPTNAIDRFSLGSATNASDHGDLIAARHYLGGNIADATNGLFVGGKDSSYSEVNVIEYVGIASAGNGTDFGDLTSVASDAAGTSNNIRGVITKGYTTTSAVSDIDYVTIATAANAADFGDQTTALAQAQGCTSPTGRVTLSGGYNGSSRVNTIQYFDIATLGNASDFGDLTHAIWKGQSFSGT